MPPRFTTAAGGDVTFRCYSATNRGQVKGPARNVQWQRADGRPLSSRITTSGNMLIMKRVESTDAGRYICQSASSQNGQTRAEAELVVSGKLNSFFFNLKLIAQLWIVYMPLSCDCYTCLLGGLIMPATFVS
jgi:Immunoglobulin domain